MGTTGGREYPEVRLREVVDADLPALYQQQRDPVAARMAATTPFGWSEHAEHWRALRADPAVRARVIVVEGAVAGSITCWRRWEQWQVGYQVDREHWGRGIATTALALFLCEVVERPLHAFAASGNAASRRVLEKCGFRPDGVEGDGSLAGYVLEG